ncbi:phosphotransferase family protein [Piscibacillus salipiscarius]|uniref:Phosphotransferase family protein n=1 Tax=Piscibacillus salipiscarius TaxID=299480 RepID=A0ABW5QE69_9BACI|nr:aminoglycoside phosphotransferase family protein [Piscibacillus salipiscarius]
MTHKHIKTIQKHYPELHIEDYYINDIGQNNDVLIVNDSLVFRFPKYQDGIDQLRTETKILNYIKDKVLLAIPNPIYYSFDKLEPGDVFTGYELIEGEPLWKSQFESIKNSEQVQALADNLVSFLIELHSISIGRVRQELNLIVNNPFEQMNQLYEKIRLKLFPYIRDEAQKEISHSFETFLKGESFKAADLSLIHGDFGASNILWNPEVSRISGVIDFGGSGLGDPAYDFAGILSSYGEEFYQLCLKKYPDSDLLDKRVKFYRSTFALQEALHGIENNDQEAFESGIKYYR